MLRDTSLKPNQQFAHYQLQEKIGEGGMGSVYRAVDLKLQRTVAIKVITNEVTSQHDVERFLREARAMAKLDHENIVQIYEVGISPVPFIAMEFLEGKTLKELIYEKLSPQKLVEIVIQIARALRVAHKQSIIHRDIKPANIIVSDGKAKLMDFGLAKNRGNSEKSLSKSGAIVGTAAYMPPEQVRGETAPTNDIYSLGAVLYEGLTGMPPFQGDNYLNILSQLVLKDPVAPRELNPDISIYLEAICLKCLHKKPQLRYQTARSLENDLDNFLQGKPVTAKPYTTIVKWQKLFAQNKMLFLMIGVFLAFLVVMSGFLLFMQKQLRNSNDLLVKEKKNLKDKVIQIENTYQFSLEKMLSLIEFFAGNQSMQDSEILMRNRERLATLIIEVSPFAPRNLLPKSRAVALQFLDAYFASRIEPKIGILLYKELLKKEEFVLLYGDKQYIHRMLGQYDEALRDCQEMLRLDPDGIHARYLIAYVKYEQGKYSEALELTTKFFEKKYDHFGIHQLRGKILSAQKKYNEAIEFCSKGLLKTPEDKALLYLRGYNYGKLRQYEKAIAEYTKAIKVDGNYTRTYFRRGTLYKRRGNIDKAIDDFEEYIYREKKDDKMMGDVYSLLGDCFFKKKKYFVAIKNYRKGLQIARNKYANLAQSLRSKIKSTQKLLKKK
ncbi:protein kinase domain-containing protein [Candidatus Uabimicrobium amorphum]|uniref:non-specific serine/threonine protein kinase n=1 Tax=Uabimicrobium amorphum TaxID=2596890 RepID=A0A5S9ISZ9_UABAM|nr:protein kinase [Candidatus Uabimicrobium amorphum]BBM86991.1 protein kinase [Candidatus Uabimicrobium amorphum]